MKAVKKGIMGLAIGALGVVFGDIGTSPLYAFHAIFGPLGYHLPITTQTVMGIVSLVLWAVTLVVSIKYILFIMRADNAGEGGIMALVALLKSSKMKRSYKWFFIFLGLTGVSLFYGDSMITPAISVLSAVEGVKTITPGVGNLIVPITLVVLSALFWIQKYGTAWIGRLFGPVMLLWFLVIALGGGWQVAQHPGILLALSPTTAAQFFIAQPAIGFIVMGAVVLAITGAEALYADMGHFGRRPIARAWFFVVFPALLLCYMGQGALLLHSSEAAGNPFMFLFPETIRIPVVILATVATLIASQSVISGAFSLTRQAIQLDFLPKMLVRFTSAHESGQIYMPFINAVLYVMVALLVITFGSSASLANAYGIAVSGTLLVDTTLFIVILRRMWRRPLWNIVLAVGVFVSVDMLFVTSNLFKITSGGWFPLLVATIIFVIITTWTRARRIVAKKRQLLEGPLQDYVDIIHAMKPPLTRIPGRAVYISHHPRRAPLALHTAVEELRELHEKVVIISVNTTNMAHVPEEERAVFDGLKYDDGISYLELSYGFHDLPNIPRALKEARHMSSELDFDASDAVYFVSLSRATLTKRHILARWRKKLYDAMDRNAMSASDYYKLPVERTVEIRSLIKL